MTDKEREALVVQALQTEKGKRALRQAIERAGAKAADHFPPGSLGEHLGRMLAGLPPKAGV